MARIAWSDMDRASRTARPIASGFDRQPAAIPREIVGSALLPVSRIATDVEIDLRAKRKSPAARSGSVGYFRNATVASASIRGAPSSRDIAALAACFEDLVGSDRSHRRNLCRQCRELLRQPPIIVGARWRLHHVRSEMDSSRVSPPLDGGTPTGPVCPSPAVLRVVGSRRITQLWLARMKWQ